MTLPLYYYVLGTPLGVLGLFRWACWLVRRIPAVLYRPIVNNYRLSMSIVVPVYQEDPVIFAAAIESWLRNHVHEVILVIDASDAGARRSPPATRSRCSSPTCRASGTPCAGLERRVDRAGGAGRLRHDLGGRRRGRGLQAVRRPADRWSGHPAERVRDEGLPRPDHRHVPRPPLLRRERQPEPARPGGVVPVRPHGGLPAALLLDVEHEFMNETFWGVPCLSGDDKRLTTLILERGYLTYMQRTAEVWSTFPNTWRIFFKQRLRWARNTWRSDLRALSRPWVYRHPFLAYTMMDKGISGFTLLLGPAFMVHSLINQNWIFAAVLAGWWQLSRSAKLLPHLRRRPSSFLFIPGYVVVSWIMALIKLQALLTIRAALAHPTGGGGERPGRAHDPRTRRRSRQWQRRRQRRRQGRRQAASAGATQGVPVPVGGRTDLVSAGMPLRPHMPGMPAGALVPRQASPTEQFPPLRARPRPYV